ncbi:unnamed protein product [Lasius platythorax]|uniref:Retrotransposon gag domain-containing protein n=1 Tax=Lasius platythorax TaxID=488582 RepID=A0AAV2MY45_9HYME
MDWEAIDIAIKGKKKTWLYGLNKADLLKVFTKYKITCSEEEDIDKLRKRLSEYITVVSKKSGPFREAEINAAIKQTIKKMSLNLTALESFKKNQSWTSYVIQLKCLLDLSDITDEKKRVQILITKLSTEAFEILCNLCAPYSPTNSTKFNFETLSTKLENNFHPKSKHATRLEFKQRKQLPTESIHEYVAALKTLTKNVAFQTMRIEYESNYVRGSDRQQCVSN